MLSIARVTSQGRVMIGLVDRFTLAIQLLKYCHDIALNWGPTFK